MSELAFHKKRRAVVRASVTKLSTKLTKLESDPDSPTLLQSATNLSDKLKSLQQDFRVHQLSIIDRTEVEAALIEEQQSPVYVFSVFLPWHPSVKKLFVLHLSN